MATNRISGNIFDLKLLNRVLKLARPYRALFLFSCALAILIAVLAPVRPAVTQKIVDVYVPLKDGKGLLYLSLLAMGLLVGEGLLRYAFTMITRYVGQHVVKDLRMQVYHHIIGSKLQYFDQTPVGTNLTRCISDVETINDVFANGFTQTLADLLMILSIIVFMFVLSWKMALLSLITIPFMFVATYFFKEGIKRTFIEVRKQITILNGFLQEHITGMKVIQILHAEEEEQRKFEAINRDLTKANIRSIWYYSLFFPVVDFLKAIALGLMVWMGAYLLLKEEIAEAGMVIAFASYIDMLFRPLRFLADRFNTLQMGLVSGERVFNLLDRDERIADDGTKEMSDMRGEIEFRNLSFSYKSGEPVIKNLSFHLAAGETLAIVGPTGSGKSSIINLLNRFYEFESGQILIDGVDIREWTTHSLRSHISVVLQDVFLFKGSIYENIVMGDERFSRKEAEAAAEQVGAAEFIQRLPGGYDYHVMERGATLSSGQRQLISFARALVFKPSLLILDEATASIDTESERLIQNAIEKLIKGRSSIVIAHRLSTIRHANKILLLEKGELKEMGSHDELMALNGGYAKLYRLQFKEERVPA